MQESNLKRIPISKKCRRCKEEKLLSEFDLNLSGRSKDKHTSTCKACVQKQEETTDQDHWCGECNNCIQSEYLQGIYHSLTSLLGCVKREEGRICLPIPILNVLIEIVKTDTANHEHGSCRYEQSS